MSVTPLLMLTMTFASLLAIGTFVTWLYDTLTAAHLGRKGVARLVPIGSHGVDRDESRCTLAAAVPAARDALVLGVPKAAPGQSMETGTTRGVHVPARGVPARGVPAHGVPARGVPAASHVLQATPFPETLPHATGLVTVRRRTGSANAA